MYLCSSCILNLRTVFIQLVYSTNAWRSLYVFSFLLITGNGSLTLKIIFSILCISIGLILKIFSCTSFIMFLNVFGIKKVGKVQIVIVSISLICLVSIFLIGFLLVNPDYFTSFLSNGNSGLISSVAFFFISYAGVTKVAAIAGEIKNPDRNLPLAMILSLLTIASIYVFIAFVLVGNIPIKDLTTDIRPIYTVSNIIGGKYFGYAAAAREVLMFLYEIKHGMILLKISRIFSK